MGSQTELPRERTNREHAQLGVVMWGRKPSLGNLAGGESSGLLVRFCVSPENIALRDEHGGPSRCHQQHKDRNRQKTPGNFRWNSLPGAFCPFLFPTFQFMVELFAVRTRVFGRHTAGRLPWPCFLATHGAAGTGIAEACSFTRQLKAVPWFQRYPEGGHGNRVR